MNSKISGAVVGLGKMGISHAAILGAHPQVELKAVCDASGFVLEAFRKHSDTKVYDSFETMLSREDSLDFVLIATPTRFHYPMVKAVLERGIHVFCEKPFTLSVQEGEELVRIATQKKLIGRVGYHNHYIGTFRLLKDLIKQNVLGEIFHFNGEAYGPVVVKDKTSTWRSKAEEGGGCLYDYASHVLNLVQEVLGWPERVGGTLLKSIYSKGVDDAVYASLRLKSGVTGTVSVNWSDETYRKMATSLTVVGKLGKIICDATEIKIYLKKPSPLFKLESGWTVKYITDLAIPVNFYLRGEEYSAQIDAFIDSITDPKKNDGLNTFEQALHTERVIHMLKEDANKNRLVA